MRVLLVNVNKPTETRIPQGLLYLASALDASGHDITIHDESFSKNEKESMDRIISFQPDVVGFNVYSFPWQLRRVESLSAAIKDVNKKIKIIWGGWHATLFSRHSALNSFVDIVVVGPGEETLLEILTCLENGKSLKSVKGIVYEQNGSLIQTTDRQIDPAGMFPKLNFRIVAMTKYLNNHDLDMGTLQYIATRGCNGRCAFCVMAKTFHGRLLRKPKQQIIEELGSLLHNYPAVRSIHFSDDNSFTNDKEALELCRIIKEALNGRVMPWRCATRISALANISEHACRAFKDTGCEGFVVGIESGSDRVLKLMKKGTNCRQIRKAINTLAEHGFGRNLFTFLFDYPGETTEEAIETINMARYTRITLPESSIMLNVYFPAASDNSILPEAHAMPSGKLVSELFDNYYDNHIRTYTVSRTRIDALRFYFNASQKTARKRGMLKKLQQACIRFRIKHGVFNFPFEFQISNLMAKTSDKQLN